jgi:hypothetical protein
MDCLPHQVASPIRWDELSILHAPKVSERLADGSILIVRDRMHPAPQPPGEPLAPSSAARRSGVSFGGAAAADSEPFRTGSAVPGESFRTGSAVPGESFRSARRTGGVQIRGPVFAEDA